MTVEEIIVWFGQFPKDSQVLAWDPDAEEWLPVTGATYAVGEPVKLYTDEP